MATETREASVEVHINKLGGQFKGELALHIDTRDAYLTVQCHKSGCNNIELFDLTKEQIIQLGNDIIKEAQK